MGNTYKTIAVLVGFIAFAASWIYCIFAYGFLIGVALGWIPAMIVGFIAGALWPIVLILGYYLYNLIFPNNNKDYIKSGYGISVTNTDVIRTTADTCSYYLEEKNASTTKQNMNIRIVLLSQTDSTLGDFNWLMKPLYTGDPRKDTVSNVPCPTYVVKNGVSKIEYVLSDYNGTIIIDNKIDVSKKYNDSTSKEASPSTLPNNN